MGSARWVCVMTCSLLCLFKKKKWSLPHCIEKSHRAKLDTAPAQALVSPQNDKISNQSKVMSRKTGQGTLSLDSPKTSPRKSREALLSAGAVS